MLGERNSVSRTFGPSSWSRIFVSTLCGLALIAGTAMFVAADGPQSSATSKPADEKEKRADRKKNKKKNGNRGLLEEVIRLRVEVERLTKTVEAIAARDARSTSPMSIPPSISPSPENRPTYRTLPPYPTNPYVPVPATPPYSTNPYNPAPPATRAATTTAPRPSPTSPAVTYPSPVRTSDSTKSAATYHKIAGHEKSVSGVAISPDGALGASVSADGGLRIWDLSTVRLRSFTKTTGPLSCVRFTPDGKRVVAGGASGLVVVESATGKRLPSFTSARGDIRSLAFSPDGKRLVTCSRSYLQLWDTATENVTHTPKVQLDTVSAVDMTNNGDVLCIGGYSNDSATPVTYFVRFWNVESGKDLFRIDHPVRTVFRGGFLSHDNQRVYTVGPEGTVREWDVATGKELRQITRDMTCAAISRDGKFLMTAGSTGYMKMYDGETGRLKTMRSLTDGWPESIAVSPDGRRILVSGRDKEIHYYEFSLLPTKWSDLPDAAEKPVEEKKTTFTIPPRPLFRMAGHTTYVYALAVSPDGKRAVSGGFDKSIRLWDLEKGEQLKVVQASGPSSIVNDIAYLPNGKQVMLACGQTRGTQALKLWDLDEGKVVATYVGHDHIVKCVAVSPNGKVAASGGNDSTVRLWNIETGELLRRLDGHTNTVDDVAFSADGSLLASTGVDHTVRIWDVATGRELRDRQPPGGGRSVEFSPTKSQLLVGGTGTGSPIRLWDYERRKELSTHPGFQQGTRNLCFSADGKTFLSSGFGEEARLGDAETGKTLLTVKAGEGPHVSPVAFASGDRRFVTINEDNVLEVWAVPEP